MAQLIIDHQNHEVAEGSKIRKICETAGVVFNCNTGICGKCEIEVISGMENLNPVQPEEIDMGLKANRRLACLCVIKTGTVEIKTI